MNAPQTLSRWTHPGSSRVPFWAYTDAQLYQRELDQIFYGDHWCYVGLEVEIPNIGDYRLTWIGERQVIMVRDRVAPKDRGIDKGIRVVENRCAHRGVRFCQQPQGNARSFVCPYHQWTYKLNGELAGLPFKDGVAASDENGEPCVNGGMPDGFDVKQHGLTQLRVAVLHGGPETGTHQQCRQADGEQQHSEDRQYRKEEFIAARKRHDLVKNRIAQRPVDKTEHVNIHCMEPMHPRSLMKNR